MIILKNKFQNFRSQTGQTSFQLLKEYNHSFQVEIDKKCIIDILSDTFLPNTALYFDSSSRIWLT